MIEIVLIPVLLLVFVPGVVCGVILARKLRQWRR